MSFEIFAALISFAGLVVMWAFAPNRPATEGAMAPAAQSEAAA